tara:strand:+ start:299 stop:1237 length:939 start_codon:yes stop_codon:yes gene_type:complete
MNKKIEILVIGAGAVGAYFGGRLAQAGASVSVVCRSDYDAVAGNGYQIKSIAGDFIFKPAQVCRDAADYQGKPDYILVTVKALPWIDVPAMIKPVIHPDATVFLLQNGVEIEPPLVETIPDIDLVSGIAYIGVTRRGDGIVEHEGGGTLAVGMYPPERPVSDKLKKLDELFAAVKVGCKVSPDIRSTRWCKLVWNAPFNPISVLGGGIDTRQIMDDPKLVELSERVMREVAAAGNACGARVPDKHIDDMLEYTRNFPPYKTSMLVDFENGRPLEVEVILGNAVRTAEAHGVDVPSLKSLYALLGSVNNNMEK